MEEAQLGECQPAADQGEKLVKDQEKGLQGQVKGQMLGRVGSQKGGAWTQARDLRVD